MMKAISYSCLVCLTLIVCCKRIQTTDENSFAHGPNMTNNVQGILVNKRNESHYSASPGMNETSKPCVVTFNDPDISAIFELAEVKITNIVDIEIKFHSNTSNKQMTRWVWTNRLGLEILSLLSNGIPENFARKSLSVGRKAAQLAVSENPPDCVFKENSRDFFAVELLKRLQSVSGVDKELCYKTWRRFLYRCCKMQSRSYNKNGHQCYLLSASQFARALQTLHSVVSYFYLSAGGTFSFVMISYLFWKSEYNNKWYHTLNESPMSLSSVLSVLFWDGYGLFKSILRRILLAILAGYLFYLSGLFNLSLYAFLLIFGSWILLLILSLDFNPQKANGYKKDNYSFNCLFFDSQTFRYSAQGAIYLLTLPFNVKNWRECLQRLHDSTKRVLKFCGYSSTVIIKGSYCLLCLFYIPVSFVFCVFCVFFMITHISISYLRERSFDSVGFSTIQKIKYHSRNTFFVYSVMLLHTLLYFMLQILIPFTYGIFLNIVYFFPYITFISVLSFYAWNFWKSVEGKYFTLKALIYEEIEDINEKTNKKPNIYTCIYNINNNNSNNNNSNNNNNINNSSNNNNNNDSSNNFDDDYEIVCVVSKELYNKIRERLLPYNKNLLNFALKLFVLVGFCYIVLFFVKTFQASDVSPAVQFLTSLSFGAVPYLLDTAFSQKGDEEKAAWKKQLRVSVKQLVIKFTTKNPKYLHIHVKKWPNGNENINESNVPDNESNVPDNESNVPDNESNAPDSESNVPDSESNVPDSESNVPDNESNVPDNESNVPDNESNVPDNESNVPVNESNVPDNESNVRDNESNVPDNESNVPDNESNVRANEINVPDNESNVPDNESNVPDNESNVPEEEEGLLNNDADGRSRSRSESRIEMNDDDDDEFPRPNNKCLLL